MLLARNPDTPKSKFELEWIIIEIKGKCKMCMARFSVICKNMSM